MQSCWLRYSASNPSKVCFTVLTACRAPLYFFHKTDIGSITNRYVNHRLSTFRCDNGTTKLMTMESQLQSRFGTRRHGLPSHGNQLCFWYVSVLLSPVWLCVKAKRLGSAACNCVAQVLILGVFTKYLAVTVPFVLIIVVLIQKLYL